MLNLNKSLKLQIYYKLQIYVQIFQGIQSRTKLNVDKAASQGNYYQDCEKLCGFYANFVQLSTCVKIKKIKM